jgi:hypothetical protein
MTKSCTFLKSFNLKNRESSDKNKEDAYVRSHSTHVRDEKMIRNFMEKPVGKSLLGDLRVDGRI